MASTQTTAERRKNLYGALALFVIVAGGLIWLGMPDSAPSAPAAPATEQLPGDWAAEIAADVLTGEVIGVNVYEPTQRVVVSYELISTDTGYASRQVTQMVCDLRGAFAGYMFVADGRLPVVDGFGNESLISGLNVRLEPETVEAINCDNAMLVNLAAIADAYVADRLME